MTSVSRPQGEFTSRTKARKRAADVVFEAEQRGLTSSSQKMEDLLVERRSLTAAQTPLPEYSQQIIAGIASHLSEVDRRIESRSKVKDLDRLPGVDLAVLRVAVWEMLYNFADVDRIIAIDEAVAIAKSISTDRSPGFVNAVLDAIRRDLEQEVTGGDTPVKEHFSNILAEDELWDELLDEY